jgi:dienelactone hydrolase
MKLPVAALAALALLAAAPSAGAAVTSAFDGKVPCTTDAASGLVTCSGPATTFDGTPIDVNLVLPSARGDFPLLGFYHGWGGRKSSTDALKGWAEKGYAAFSMSDRGWGESCGGQSASRLTPACAKGYNHLLDTRYEVRDAQVLMGQLVDEGLVDPQRLGATGGSYGGGMSMALAALRDRVMLPDGRLAPWTSPKKSVPMRLAVAAPEIPWTDLAYALQPNGRNLDYLADNEYGTRIGVLKTTFVAGLYATGLAASNYAPPGADPDADLTKWFALTNAGDLPAGDSNPLAVDILDELRSHHSSYTIPPSVEPAPMLISSGWTDDLFPPMEAIRFYNRTRSAFPGHPISLFFLDYGHQRGQNKPGDIAHLKARQETWFEHYLLGRGPRPFIGAEAVTQTCPKAAPGEGPFRAPTWDSLSPGEVRFTSAAQQVVASGGDPRAGQAYDPVAGGGACATSDSTPVPGTATYTLPPVTEPYTLLGSPTIVATLTAPLANQQLAARLVDVAPDGKRTLVARGVYRPEAVAVATRQVWQINANGWRFAPGHRPQLELLAHDAPYARPSNVQPPVLVQDLELRLPVLEGHGGNAAVLKPATPIVPAGARLAR